MLPIMKECAYTRRLLPRYLQGHVFLPQERRIERHLSVCPFCRSEHDVLRRANETREILRDIAPEEGMAGWVLRRASRLSGLKRLLYRPLWLAAILVSAGVLYLYVITPLLHDPDLERLESGASLPSGAPASAPSPTAAALSGPARPVKQAIPAAQIDPLLITITIDKEDEKAAIQHLNDAMKEHAFLRAMRYSESVREISGNLTADELYTFFDRIRSAGKVSYKRSRLRSGQGEMIPFVMRLRISAAAEQRPTVRPVNKPVDQPGEKAVDIPVGTPVDKPVVNQVELPPNAPASAAQPASPPAQ